jgi:hypothetical protein
MASERPSYIDIVLAYLSEGGRAWRNRDSASAVDVQKRLGLSDWESIDFMRHLEELGLVASEEVMNSSGAYRLLPKGLAFVEGLPSLEQIVTVQARAIESSSEQPKPAKDTAKTVVRDTLIRQALERGVAVVVDNLPYVWRVLRMQFPWLPDLKP